MTHLAYAPGQVLEGVVVRVDKAGHHDMVWEAEDLVSGPVLLRQLRCEADPLDLCAFDVDSCILQLPLVLVKSQ